ncbi:MAG TPA: biotin/lipoyl-containing protein, partial [Gemmatimonadales bacterium]|nr:biotin/lipoyl-containing protein [Gemmatimonadales bacterium]
MAKIDVIMPQMGESIAEGTLSRWMKQVGDTVKRDEPIFEISTDKVDAEIPAPAAGVLAEILVTEGQTVAVQTVVAKIETEAGAAVAPAASAPAPAAPASAAPAATASTPTASAPTASTPAEKPAPPKAAPSPAPVTGASARPSPAPAARSADVAGNGANETAEERLRRRSTPLVRKMAAEHNLDLSAIPGSGLAGRVTKNDILSYLESGSVADAPSAPRSPAGEPAAAAAAPAASRPSAPVSAPA